MSHNNVLIFFSIKMMSCSILFFIFFLDKVILWGADMGRRFGVPTRITKIKEVRNQNNNNNNKVYIYIEIQ
jgi:hypothetical protein